MTPRSMVIGRSNDELPTEVVDRMRRAKDFVKVNRGMPVIAPKWLIDQPIWHEPERAARFSSSRAVFYEAPRPGQSQPVRIVVETNNDLKLTKSRFCSGGLLRWKDMDIAVAASCEFTRSGSRFLECNQSDLLAWIGYDESVPHRDICGSLDRLHRTAIALYFEGEECQKSHWFTIFSECSSRNDGRAQGCPTIIRAQLSESWLDAFRGLREWTVFDLACYAHLARANRRLGLARALYLYLASKRHYGDLTFSASAHEVYERFADKSLITRQPLYSNPIDKRSKLFRAMEFLVCEGVVKLKNTDKAVVSGVFVRPDNIMTFDDYSRQLGSRRKRRTTLSFNPGIFLGERKPLAVTSPQKVQHADDSQRKITEQISEKELPLAARALLKMFPSIDRKELQQALDAGWTGSQMGHLLGYTLWREDDLERPVGFLVAALRKGTLDASDRCSRWCESGVSADLNGTTYEEWGKWSKRQMELELGLISDESSPKKESP